MLAVDTAVALAVASAAAVVVVASMAAVAEASTAVVAVASTAVAVADPTVAAVTDKKIYIFCEPGCFGSRAFLLPEAWASRMTFEEAQDPRAYRTSTQSFRHWATRGLNV